MALPRQRRFAREQRKHARFAGARDDLEAARMPEQRRVELGVVRVCGRADERDLDRRVSELARHIERGHEGARQPCDRPAKGDDRLLRELAQILAAEVRTQAHEHAGEHSVGAGGGAVGAFVHTHREVLVLTGGIEEWPLFAAKVQDGALGEGEGGAQPFAFSRRLVQLDQALGEERIVLEEASDMAGASAMGTQQTTVGLT